MTQTTDTAGLTARMAAFAVAPDLGFSDNALRIARLSALDWCACTLAGVEEPVSRITRALVADEGGRGEATVVGGGTAPARAAALANGATSHALDYDDTHFDYVGHPSVAIFPAALAMAERLDASGADLLRAFLVGVETACRIGHILGTPHYQFGFHQTSTSGSFGAAAAAARLMGLSASKTAHALGIAATRASGLKSQFGTMGKPFHAGMAAANGIEAALLASHGFVSRPDGIECVQGFIETHQGEAADVAGSLEGLGRSWRFEAVQHKYHACCHGTHAGLEALHMLRREGLEAAEIASVTLRINPRWLRVCNIPAPTTGLEAKFSYRLTTAMALTGLETGALSTFSDAACADAGLIALRDRVQVEADGAIPDTAAEVIVVRTSGETIIRAHDLDQPIAAEVQNAKIEAKVAALVGVGRARGLIACITGLDKISARDVGRILAGA